MQASRKHPPRTLAGADLESLSTAAPSLVERRVRLSWQQCVVDSACRPSLHGCISI